jgi:hypothetical protein
MIEKVKKVYDEIKHKYSEGKNTTKERFLLETELLFDLGDQFEVICDETNNPSNIMDYNCLVAKVIWEHDKRTGSCKYTELVFGDENNVGHVQMLLNI